MKNVNIQDLFDKYYELCLIPKSNSTDKINLINEIWNMLKTYVDNELMNFEIDIDTDFLDNDDKEEIIHMIFKTLTSNNLNNIFIFKNSHDFIQQHLWNRRN